MKPFACLALLVAVLAHPTLCVAYDKADHHIRFWELLMLQPAGRDTPPPPEPTPPPPEPVGCQLPNGQTCVPNSLVPTECCSDARDTCGLDSIGAIACCRAFQVSCETTSQCCGTLICDPNQANTCQGCFSRDTKVMTRESAQPVALRDLRVGQHVLCYEAGHNMLVPGAPTWCEVRNFFRADDATAYPDMVRLTVRAADGSTTTSTVSWVHLLHLVTDPAPRLQAATPGELGAFVNELATNIKPGQLTPVPTSAGLNATYQLGVIERVEVIEALGKMIPAVEHPFIWADGIVQPIWAGWFRPTSSRGAQHGMTFPVEMHAANAFRHIVHAPLWMTGRQVKGTPGKHAQWDGNQRAPLMETLTASLEGRGAMPISGAANFTAALEWFVPRYEAWKADPSKAITEAEVLAVWPSLFTAADTSASCPAAAANCPAQQVFLYSPEGLRPVSSSLTA